MRSRWLRWTTRVAVTGVALTGLIGVMHMPFAAPLLRRISPSFVCPIQHGTPEQVDRAHNIGAASIRASAQNAAPARPALGFTLDQSTKADLDAWAKKNDVSCDAIAGNQTLQRCLDVPAAAVGEDPSLGPLEEATFEFSKAGPLVNVQTMRRHLTNADASRVVTALETQVESTIGAPTQSVGDASSAALSRSVLSTYLAEHTYTDYRATVSATNLAKTGTMVREQYLSLR